MSDPRDSWWYSDPSSQVGGKSLYESPQQRKKIPETTVTPDNPPAYFYPHIVTVDDPPLPTLPKYLVQGLISAVSVPFRAAAVMASIVAAWAPDLAYASIGGAQPYAPRLGSPALIAPAPVVNNPPFSHPGRTAGQAAITGSAWQVTDPLPTVPRHLTPPSVDNPPGFYRPTVVVVPRPPLPTLPPKLTPPSVDNPPFTHPSRTAARASIISSSWQVPDPSPTLAVKLTPPSVDNPPPLVRVPQPYVEVAPQPFLPGKLTPPSVDNPPPRSAFVPFYPEAAPPLPTLPSKVAAIIPVTPAQADNPPFSSWSRSAAYAAVVSYAWLPPDPLPTLAGKIAPLIPPAQVDNPPSYFYPAIVTIDDPPLPTLGQRNVAAIIPPAQVDNPPFSHRGRSASIASLIAGLWQAPDPLPTLAGKSAAIIPARADNPPFGLKPFSWGWGEPSITSIAVGDLILPNDNPPFSNPGRLAYLTAVINAAWLPPDPLPTLGGKIAAIIPVTPPQVDNPPAYFYPSIVTVDDPPLPILGQRNIAAIIQPARVDNPPFSYAGRAAYLATLVNAAWQPPDPLPTLIGKSAGIIPPPQIDNPPFLHRGRTAYLATLVNAAWQPPDPLPTLIGKSAGVIPPPVVNNPPFTHRGRDPLPWIILQWQAPDPLPWIPFFNNASWNPGPPAPTGQGIQFTVSGDGVRQLFEDPGSVSHTWSGVSHRTV